MTECDINKCDGVVVARGWCKRHYRRWQRHGDPLAGRTEMGEPMRFLERLPLNVDECIEWPYAQGGTGYGTVIVNGATTSAHRQAAVIHHGPPPTPGMHAAHEPDTCHNPLCVNPTHIRWATPTDNRLDMRLDRTIVGKKLDPPDVLNIHKSDVDTATLARRYGVSTNTISNIRAGRTWAWLTQIAFGATRPGVEQQTKDKKQ